MIAKNYIELISSLKGRVVDRPNKKGAGTLSGHAAGEPFEKLTYKILKEKFPSNIYKQYEFLNDLYLKNPRSITVQDKYALINSPVALFLLSRGDKATKEWDVENPFEEKQNDTADILWYKDNVFSIIDIKTRNISKDAQPPNIISSYKLANMCACMIDNNDFDSVKINYIEIDWEEKDYTLKCIDAHWKDLFKCNPDNLYINWAAAMQIQFHVCDLNQNFNGTTEEWARRYLKTFVKSAKERCRNMYEKFVVPFEKYIKV
jgi:type II restriction enzyme